MHHFIKDFQRMTEEAALSTLKWIGSGNENLYRTTFNQPGHITQRNFLALRLIQCAESLAG